MVAEKAFPNQDSLSDTSGPHSRSRGTHLHTFQEKSRKISNHLEKQRRRKIKVKGEHLDARREEQWNNVALFSSITESSLKNTGWSLPAPKSTGWQELKSFKCRLSWMFLKSIVLTAPTVYSWKKTTVQPTGPVSSLGVPRGKRKRLRVPPKEESI